MVLSLSVAYLVRHVTDHLHHAEQTSWCCHWGQVCQKLIPAEQPRQAARYDYGTVDDESFIHNQARDILVQLCIRTVFCDGVKQVYSPF